MDEKITCLVLTYNEESRITNALTHAGKWADEVLIVDKASTDKTAEIAKANGARVETIPFSRQGHEDVKAIMQLCAHDWIWAFTPGEVPTPELIVSGKSAISDDADLIFVPVLIYSFGVHDPRSPWGISMQPRLLHRRRARIENRVHDNFSAAKERTRIINRCERNFVLHQTPATAESFLSAHADYMIAEAAKPEPEQTYLRALGMCNGWDSDFRSSPLLLKQMLAWKIYWLGVALHCLEKNEGVDVPKQYRERAYDFLQAWK